MSHPDPYLADLQRQLPTVRIDGAGTVVEVGEAATIAFDLDPTNVIGRAFDEVFPVQSEEGAEIRAVAAGPPNRPSHRVQAVFLGDAAGPALVVLQDMTRLLRLRTECLSLTRLASAGRLISSIVHEINNPLSGIIGYSQLLLMRELDRDVRSWVEKVFGEALRTSRIVKNLLDFARRRGSGRNGPVHLGRVIRKALELKSHDLRVKNVSVHLDVADTLPPVVGDPHQLLQVLVNLISNSEQAMYAADHGGRITMEARATPRTVTLVLRDTGPGIAEHLRERVFEPFFTTKSEGQGTGLGLALCRDLLRQHRAAIQLLESSEPGAAFLLTFPLYRADEVAAAGTPRTCRVVKVRGRRIVVVEDDPVVRSLVAEAFERSGNTVAAFDRSEPALRYLHRQRVDAVISDLHRPGLNGIEFHEQVCRFDPHLARRILFLTGDTLNDRFAEFLRRHGNPHLPKPVLLRDLFEAVQSLLEANGTRQRTLFETDGPPRAAQAGQG